MDEITGIYNYWLVALSFCVAILTSYATVDIAIRITANRGAARLIWLLGGAIAMGTGIWGMHYIGMLAYVLPVPVLYHIPTVVLSLMAAIAASFAALSIASRKQMNWVNAISGSFVMGSGIAAMHYIGMASMRLKAMHHYNHRMWVISIALAMVISSVGLILIHYMHNGDRGKLYKLAIVLTLGLAIPVMHYTGMAAVSFTPMAEMRSSAYSVDISSLSNMAIFIVIAMILVFTLVTSLIERRISAQRLLLKNERKMLRALIDHIPDCMYVKDIEGRFLLANIRMAQMMGVVDPQLLIGKSDDDFYPAWLVRQYREDELKVMKSGEALYEHEEAGLDASGNNVPMLTTKVPLRDGLGNVIGIAGVGRDITERKKSENALQEAEQKYKSMFDEALVGIFKLDSKGHLLQVNPAMAESLGYESPEDMYASIPGPLWTKAVSAERQSEFMTKMQDTGYVKSFELEIFRKDGGKIWISSSARTKYRDGVMAGFVGVFEDITERRALREQLLQAQKLESVGQLAAGIAHEINTPVQYIGDNVRFLKDTVSELALLNGQYARLLATAQAGQLTAEILAEITESVKQVDVEYLFEEIPKAIDQTLEGVTRVAGLVGAMKEFSHPGTGEKVPFDLNRAIESTITVARNEWKYVADMNVDLDPCLPLVSCLPGEFNQVILNMIVNAAHSIADVAASGGAAKGLITIQTRCLSGQVEIRIQDTGKGIPEKARARIFDPFFTTKEIGKGTGQGLAIARSVVVDKHQGSIAFDTQEGRGTTFMIRLPFDSAESVIETKVAA